MRELSLNILDICENSIAANAKCVGVTVSVADDVMTIRISDDGKGMSPEFLESVIDPFTTTRTTRKVGMGIPLFKMAAEITGGSFSIKSELGKGTVTEAAFVIGSIDRAPLGNLAETMASLVLASPETEFVLDYTAPNGSFRFDTGEIKETIGEIPIESPEIIRFIREMIAENINEANGGLVL